MAGVQNLGHGHPSEPRDHRDHSVTGQQPGEMPTTLATITVNVYPGRCAASGPEETPPSASRRAWPQ